MKTIQTSQASLSQLVLAVAHIHGWTRVRPVINGVERHECWWPPEFGDPQDPSAGACAAQHPQEFLSWKFCGSLIDRGYNVDSACRPSRFAWYMEDQDRGQWGDTARTALLRAYVNKQIGEDFTLPESWEKLL